MYRHYRPDLGRYVTPDPIGLAGGTNLYGYAGQNPVNYADPIGLSWLDDFGYETAQLLVGFGDMVSLGATKSIRQTDWYGPDYFTDQSSFGYGTGRNAGIVALTYLGFEAAPAVLAGGASILGGLQSAISGTYGWLTAQGQTCVSGAESSAPAVNGRLYSVYAGVDEYGVVRYIGMTSRGLLVRAAEHLRAIGTGRDMLRYRLVSSALSLSYTEARVMEQMLINQYGLSRYGGTLLNVYNSIAPKYWPMYGIY